MATGKGDPRAAAERIEHGIEKYGEGDLVACAVELEEALRLAPEHPRAKHYLAWVKDVLAGQRTYGNGKNGELDEDALRAVTEALDSPPSEDEEKPESPWDPVPLTPGGSEAPRAIAVAPVAPPVATRSNPGTILGVAPPRENVLTPMARARPVEDRPDSVTREWGRGTPTGANLPPLDVPELTEDQISELISLESSLPPGHAQRSSQTDLARTPDIPTEERKAFIEFEAEPTPTPRPMSQTLPGVSLRRDETSPDSLKLQPLPFASDFEPLELTPTNARLTMPKRPGTKTSENYPELNPLPLDERIDTGDETDSGSYPTNPFIKAKLHEYAGMGTAPKVEELPPAPTQIPATETFAEAKRALAEGDVAAALAAVESVVVPAGGVDADACLPHLSLLERVYESAIGALEQVPRHGQGVPDLDPRAAFLLSRLDGNLTVEDLLDVSGMPRLEALRVLALLIQHGAVVMS